MNEKRIHVACLCAAWCRLCDEYAAVLASVTEEVKACCPDLQVRWVDIEDEAELVGEVDVETFPTVVVVGPEGVRFAGPLAPQADVLRRLLRIAVLDPAPHSNGRPADPELARFADRLRALG